MQLGHHSVPPTTASVQAFVPFAAAVRTLFVATSRSNVHSPQFRVSSVRSPSQKGNLCRFASSATQAMRFVALSVPSLSYSLSVTVSPAVLQFATSTGTSSVCVVPSASAGQRRFVVTVVLSG